ncbi:MAG: DUF5615 family PIN-like protein [Armatimonadetes bacterium]|nr:DUF5615 family PIN-like protein [Armatimonadota bacterium]
MKRLLMDEYIPPLYCKQLLRYEPELIVREVSGADAPPKGTSDPDLLVWCETYGFMLITSNRKSMPVHLADHLNEGRHIPDIL